MTAGTHRAGRTLVIIGALGVWTGAAALLGFMLLGLASPPGLGLMDWPILGLSLIFVAGLPFVTRRAIRRGGRAAWVLVVLGVGVCLLTAPPLVLVATSAETGLWPIIIAGILALGAALALGAWSLTRSR